MNHLRRDLARLSLVIGGALMPLLLGACSGADTPRAADMSRAPTVSASPPQRWPGPVRPDSGRPTLSAAQAKRWADPRDVSVGAIDVRTVEDARAPLFRYAGDWHLVTAEPTPRWGDLYQTDRMFQYGVVVDGDGDGVADCEVGLGNHPVHEGQTNPFPEQTNAWVTNLRTGVRADWGSPDFPFTFGTAGELGYPTSTFTTIGFLRKDPAPCDRFGAHAAFYVWTSAALHGQVMAWDYAPDTAWLPMPCDKECRTAPDLVAKEQTS